MNTDCDVILDLLSPYASGSLSEQSRELVRTHLETCETCRALLEVLKTPEYDLDLAPPAEEKPASRSRILLAASLGSYGLVVLILLIWGLAAEPKNTLQYTLVAFYLTLPVAAAACAWAGAGSACVFRWYLPLGFSAVSVLLNAAVLHSFSWTPFFFTLLPGIVGMLLGEAIRVSRNI